MKTLLLVLLFFCILPLWADDTNSDIVNAINGTGLIAPAAPSSASVDSDDPWPGLQQSSLHNEQDAQKVLAPYFKGLDKEAADHPFWRPKEPHYAYRDNPDNNYFNVALENDYLRRVNNYNIRLLPSESQAEELYPAFKDQNSALRGLYDKTWAILQDSHSHVLDDTNAPFIICEKCAEKLGIPPANISHIKSVATHKRRSDPLKELKLLSKRLSNFFNTSTKSSH